jgi:hypothetical protein
MHGLTQLIAITLAIATFAFVGIFASSNGQVSATLSLAGILLALALHLYRIHVWRKAPSVERLATRGYR